MKIKKWLTAACIDNTVISLLILFFRSILNGISKGNVSLLSFFMIFPCALFLTLPVLLEDKVLSDVGKRLLSFVSFTLGIFLFLWLPYAWKSEVTKHVVVLLLIALIYWLGVLIKSVSKKRLSKMKEEKI